ncbi:MAG TPA: linear amide C-N hydrolase [Bacteroidota bacterium]|nr:linear amide C-N hydrolase [Bacteroidota bacterium]
MRPRMVRVPLIAFILLVLSFALAYPCTTFVLRQGNRIIFGRNLDWITGTGLMMTNPRGLEKTALGDPSDKPIKWVSKFGSITFNQVGRELPYGGMNEAGLVVEHMTLDETVYPSRDDRCSIGACQWIQFQLDNFSTIDGVLSSDTLLRIVDAGSKFHFLICDRSGHVAVIEFLHGKMVSHTGKDLPVAVLANSTYEQSIACYQSHGDTRSNGSLYNFCTAAQQIQRGNSSSPDSSIAYAFGVLDAVRQGLSTKWSIVYDITTMKIYFKVFETPTLVGERKIFVRPPGEAFVKTVDFAQFGFSCGTTTKVLDLDYDREGTVNQDFTDYSYGTNREFISKAFAFFKAWGIGIQLKEEQIDYLARYPESSKCIKEE